MKGKGEGIRDGQAPQCSEGEVFPRLLHIMIDLKNKARFLVGINWHSSR